MDSYFQITTEFPLKGAGCVCPGGKTRLLVENAKRQFRAELFFFFFKPWQLQRVKNPVGGCIL